LILYLDSSAMVKLYARELGTDEVKSAVNHADLVAASLIAYTETRAALARKRRAGDISNDALHEHKREFEYDWARLHHLPVDEAAVRKAGEMAERYGLRGFDALHLASADSLQEVLATPLTFVCFDGALRAAAARHGLLRLLDD